MLLFECQPHPCFDPLVGWKLTASAGLAAPPLSEKLTEPPLPHLPPEAIWAVTITSTLVPVVSVTVGLVPEPPLHAGAYVDEFEKQVDVLVAVPGVLNGVPVPGAPVAPRGPVAPVAPCGPIGPIAPAGPGAP
jgi:hypothetical protein